MLNLYKKNKTVKAELMWRYRIHGGKFKPTYIQHTKPTSSAHIRCPSQGRGGCGCWWAEGTIWRNLSTGGLGPQCVRALCWLFQQPCFPKARKKGHKRGALSRGSLQQLASLQEHGLANLKTVQPACTGAYRTFTLVKEDSLKVKIDFS